jgi:hypothetical protein
MKKSTKIGLAAELVCVLVIAMIALYFDTSWILPAVIIWLVFTCGLVGIITAKSVDDD